MGFLGVLMLQTRFPRPLGDVGHPGSWRMPVRFRTVPGASPQRVVRERSAGLLQPFVDAARALVDEGASAITTSCGFLALFQRELSAALPVPVWTSSLLKLPELAAAAGCLPGLLTVDADALGPDHLLAAGASADTPVQGLAAGCHLQRTLLDDRASLDTDAARGDVLAAVQALRSRHPRVNTLVLECTNLPPYADDIRRATGWPVHDITTLAHERWKALDLR
jgi:hypothetical protein